VVVASYFPHPGKVLATIDSAVAQTGTEIEQLLAELEEVL
jgi:hypothetical protein